MRWNILSAKKHSFKLGRHKVEGTVTVQWEFEDYAPRAGHDFDFGDANDNARYEARFGERGDLANVVVSVIVRAEGLEGIDTLGGCHVSFRDFDKDLMQLVNDHAMIETATDEVAKNILEASIRLQKYAKGA